MFRGGKALFVLAALTVIACALVACGGGSATGAGGDPPSPSQAFIKPGSKTNKYAQFGKEASSAEREAASKVLTQNFRARAAGDWGRQCATLSPAAVKHVEEENSLLGAAEEGCPAALKLAAEPLEASAKARANTLDGPIDVLRVKGTHAYALYHGKAGKDYAMPMEKVGGTWKTAALATTEIQ